MKFLFGISGSFCSHVKAYWFLLLITVPSYVSATTLEEIILENYQKKPSVVVAELEKLDSAQFQEFSPTILVKASYSAAVKANIDLTLELTDILLNKARLLEDEQLVGQAHYNRGAAYAQSGNHNLALDSLLLSLYSFENSESEKDIARIKGGLALIYVEIGEYALARPYFKEALASHRARNDKANLAIVLQNQGFLKIQLGEYKAAKENLLQALAYALELGHKSFLPTLYKNLGKIESELGNSTQAFEYFEKAIKESEQSGLEHHQSEILREYATLKYSLGEIEDAKTKLQRSFVVAERNNLLKQQRNNYLLLAEIEASQQNYKAAYLAREKAAKTTDKMGESKIAGNLSRLDRYTTRLKEENKRLVLEQENKIANLAAEREQLLRNFSVAVAGIAFLLVIYFFRRFSHTNRQAVHYEKQSKIDSLTGVWNRRAGESQLTRLCARDTKSLKVFSIAMLDIDHFKQVNDKFGHDVGDQVIIAICDLIQESLRPTDMLCRWGGEEFIIIWDNFNAGKAFDICERIRHKIESANIEPIGELTVSIGISMFEDDDIYELIKRGDQALYDAKHLGRNRVIIKNKPKEKQPAEETATMA